MDVVGEASTGAEAITQARALGPDIIVMDLHMPDLNGVEATRQILAIAPGTAVLSMFDDDDSVFAVMRAGARGYLLKDSDAPEVLRAIAAAGNGEAIFGPTIAARVLAYLTRPLSAYDQQLFPELTTREREILDLMAAGKPNGEIARQLFISPKTVRNNISSIFAKLQVADRAHAIIRARSAGLGSGDS
jgi:DNA-binding NarL/FixJ family response regulator